VARQIPSGAARGSTPTIVADTVIETRWILYIMSGVKVAAESSDQVNQSDAARRGRFRK
jgi:hypothetical protein